MIEILLLLIISSINRIGAVLNAKTDFDTFGHLYFAKEVSDQKVGPFGKIQTKVAGTRGFKSQFLWHWFLGFLNIDRVIKFQKWINPVFDIVFTIIIYLVSLQYGFSTQLSFCAALLYLFTPMWFSRISLGPRIKSLTPRLSSEIATNLFFIATLLPLGLSFEVQIILGVLLCSYVILSFRFGLQAIFLLTPLASLIAADFTPLYSLIISLILSIAISKGEFISTLKYQYIHLKWYFKKSIKGGMAISNRNSIRKLYEGFDKKGGFRKKAFSLIWRMLRLNSYTSVVLKMPLYIITIFYAIYAYISGAGYALPAYLMGALFAATIIYWVSSTSYFLFIGEAERYLNHMAVFIILPFILIAESTGNNLLLYAILGYGIIYWIFESFVLHKFEDDESEKDKSSREVFDYLKKKDESSVIILFPYHALYGVWQIMLDTRHQVVCHMASDGEYRNKLEKKYALTYPYLNLNLLEDMQEDYGVDLLIIDRDHLHVADMDQWVAPQGWVPVGVGSEHYDVFLKN